MPAGRGGLSALFRALAWVPVGLVFTQNAFSVITIKGNSMQPTFNPDSSWRKDLVLLNRLNTVLKRLQRGDVVTLWDPMQPNLLITKRILALSGDLVRTLPPYPDKYVRIPPGHAWVEGDEPFHSGDSNHFGPVPLGLVDARVEAVLWPLSRAGFLRQHHQHAAAQGSLPLSAVPRSKSPAWSEFRAEEERARHRMRRVLVGVGEQGTEGREEDWKRDIA